MLIFTLNCCILKYTTLLVNLLRRKQNENLITRKRNGLLSSYLFDSCYQYILIYNYSDNFQQDPHMCRHFDKDQVSTR